MVRLDEAFEVKNPEHYGDTDCQFFRTYARRLFNAGYTVVPIAPGQKRPLLHEWPRLSETLDEALVSQLELIYPRCGVGILAHNTPGIDIDVRIEGVADRIEALAREILGSAPVRYGQAPKRLLVYKTLTPFSKITSSQFKFPGEGEHDKPHAVEVLGKGQQFIAYAIHPGTGCQYYWEGDGLTDLRREKLTCISESQARDFIRAAEDLLERHGAVQRKRLFDEGTGEGEHEPSIDLRGDPSEIRSAVAAIPNEDVDYDDWVRLGLAVKGALGDEGQEVWREWSGRSSKHDPEFSRETWQTFRPKIIGAGTIKWLARQYGWIPHRDSSKDGAKAGPREGNDKPGPDCKGANRDWRAKLIVVGLKRRPRSILANAITAFQDAPELEGLLGFDAFYQRTVMLGQAPWADGPGNGRAWASADDIRAAEWLQRHDIFVEAGIAARAVEVVAQERRFHPVLQYLDRCAWDRVERLDTWLITYLGAPETPYVRAVGPKWMISGVARVREPGSKVDCSLILEGKQGARKSTALKTLGGPWFTDDVADLGTKDAAMQITGTWIVEIAELQSMSRSEVGRIKAFMSRTTDHFRPPYGRRVADFPRQCIFAGTVNLNEYLRDETGGRRFWPITCTTIQIDELARDRDQLWAEARARYETGERWWIESPELNAAAEEEQAARYQVDAWSEPIEAYLTKISELLGNDVFVTVGGILSEVFQLSNTSWTQRDQNRVAGCLRFLGWWRHQERDEKGRRHWRYRPPPDGVTVSPGDWFQW